LIASEQDTQRVKDLRFAHRLWSFTIDPRNLVFIDETGIHLGMTRLRGRAPVGERLYDNEAPGDAGKNISLMGAMSLDGLLATMTVVGSVNTQVFLYYIQEILIPPLWVGANIVMETYRFITPPWCGRPLKRLEQPWCFCRLIRPTFHRLSYVGQNSSHS
jgi:hypothetical protein